MMNSPCAMLITFIWPKVSERPSAMSSSTAPMLMPVKSLTEDHCHRRLRTADAVAGARAAAART